MVYKYINPEYLDSIANGDNELIREIVDMFRDQSAEIYIEMKALLDRKEYLALGLLAHKAKSSVAIMGMADLATLLKTFELNARESIGINDYESYIARYSNDTEEAIKELYQLLDKRKGIQNDKY
jgi:HPt (histidine-containing phosphotransfer) domain-containing protein